MKTNHDEIEVGTTQDLSLRVSVATYNRVLFPHPQSGTLMLALERKATVVNNDGEDICVRAQPFGGAVRILDPTGLQRVVGEIEFDSERSRSEQDFRILIAPSQWEAVKQYCLGHLGNPDDVELESTPHRELIEELEETLNVNLHPGQYTAQPLGFVIENNPVPTDHVDVQGQLTVRIYRNFEVRVVDASLFNTMLATSQHDSDRDLGALALQDLQNGGRGWANSILTLPLRLVTRSYLALPPEMRYQKLVIENHELDESVLAILENVDLPQYQRL